MWRAAGFLLTATACALVELHLELAWTLVLFLMALLGLPFVFHGRRVVQRLRAEHHGHGHTVNVIHAAQLCRRGQNTDGFGN